MRARELLRRDVHAHAEVGMAERTPTARLLACGAEDEASERKDQARLLRERHEAVGPDEAAHRVFPAYERLDAHRHSRLERDDGLVVELELLRRDRALQLRLQRQPLEDA